MMAIIAMLTMVELGLCKATMTKPKLPISVQQWRPARKRLKRPCLTRKRQCPTKPGEQDYKCNFTSSTGWNEQHAQLNPTVTPTAQNSGQTKQNRHYNQRLLPLLPCSKRDVMSPKTRPGQDNGNKLACDKVNHLRHCPAAASAGPIEYIID